MPDARTTVTTRQGRVIVVTFGRPASEILRAWAADAVRRRIAAPAAGKRTKTKIAPAGG